jgi:hypothetical protein
VHFSVLVVGPDVHLALEPFCCEHEVEPYWQQLDQWSLGELIRRYGPAYSDADLVEFAEEVELGRVRQDAEGLLQTLTTSNPDARWDWYEVGGRWEGLLALRELADHDLCHGVEFQESEATWSASAAPAGMIDWNRVPVKQVNALLIDGVWYGSDPDPAAFRAWLLGAESDPALDICGSMLEMRTSTRSSFEQMWDGRIASIAPDAMVTIVDCHT